MWPGSSQVGLMCSKVDTMRMPASAIRAAARTSERRARNGIRVASQNPGADGAAGSVEGRSGGFVFFLDMRGYFFPSRSSERRARNGIRVASQNPGADGAAGSVEGRSGGFVFFLDMRGYFFPS